MKLSAQRFLIALLLLVIGGIVGYFIGTAATSTPAFATPRTINQLIADSSAHSTGSNRGELRVVTSPSVVMIASNNATDYKCSTDYGGTLRKVTDLPGEFNRRATVMELQITNQTDVLLEYRTPARETGKIFANTSTCTDGQLIATAQQTFEQAQVPAAK